MHPVRLDAELERSRDALEVAIEGEAARGRIEGEAAALDADEERQVLGLERQLHRPDKPAAGDRVAHPFLDDDVAERQRGLSSDARASGCQRERRTKGERER